MELLKESMIGQLKGSMIEPLLFQIWKFSKILLLIGKEWIRGRRIRSSWIGLNLILGIILLPQFLNKEWTKVSLHKNYGILLTLYVVDRSRVMSQPKKRGRRTIVTSPMNAKRFVAFSPESVVKESSGLSKKNRLKTMMR